MIKSWQTSANQANNAYSKVKQHAQGRGELRLSPTLAAGLKRQHPVTLCAVGKRYMGAVRCCRGTGFSQC